MFIFLLLLLLMFPLVQSAASKRLFRMTTTAAKRSLASTTTTNNDDDHSRDESTKNTLKRHKNQASLDTPSDDNTSHQAKVNTTMPSKFEFEGAHTFKNQFSIVSWNVNSLAASLKKSCASYVLHEQADVVCLQETKANSNSKLFSKNSEQDNNDWKKLLELYPHVYAHSGTAKKGYAGSALLCKEKPLSILKGFHPDSKMQDDEGRVMTAEFDKLFVVACYIPNASTDLKRLDWKTKTWMQALKSHIQTLSMSKPTILTGDLNVCLEDIDLARPKENLNKTAGFTDQERDSMRDMATQLDLKDTWRQMHPELQRYTYFSYRFNCRSKNLGWRLDYFYCPAELLTKVLSCEIREAVWGASDHVPLLLTLDRAAVLN